MTNAWTTRFDDAPRLIELDGATLCVQIRGGGGPTVVLEAAGSGQGVGGSWGPAVEDRLAEVATVVTYDRRGVGRSSGTPRRTITAMADDLHELIRTVEIGPAVIVSWSYGSLVSAVHAVRHPEDVAGLVFVDPTPITPPPTPRALRIPLQHLAVAQLRALGWASARGFFHTPAGTRMSTRLAGPDATDDIVEQSTRFHRTPRAVRELADTLSRMDSHLTETARILGAPGARLPQVPTTVIAAGRRPAGMPAAHRAHVEGSHEQLAALAPGGRVVVAENATHQIPYEDPDVVIRHTIESLPDAP
ncbi:pimeloyl-ACP methyl ester carboxylesterase [Actinoalloteichus hoggarensis]|uniref:Putative aminoacrylate hydrolase RutD n=1 Tax=Actinoalloteichus hoggarensis TaxID=1470176 RepID=A0A221VYN1_9PSEU|nr:alpha/beta hydrolase [Actinoalloteichus hoggarensis]ASO18643.1 Putative aminoacrylate hydrolase RutD [Actinoalloteichus hoggarensis]MBB5922012.1 pimeloyl-ACP methyl ester carboxylesterase [Actinoalloteichus hoggarensis]